MKSPVQCYQYYIQSTDQSCTVLTECEFEVGVFVEVVFELTPQHHTVGGLEVRLHLLFTNLAITKTNK